MRSLIFVSSTFSDLQRHRQLVCEAIDHLKFDTQAMESFGALPEAPKDECLRLVRSANIYVGIFAMRYGFVDPEASKSFTQLEYEEAQVMHLPSLIYLINEEEHPVLPKYFDVGSAAEDLRALKSALKKSHVVNFFSSPEDLATKVAQDLVKLVGAMATQPMAQVLSQLAANVVRRHPLTSLRFEYLMGRISGIFKCEVPDSILREAFELTIAGDNMAAALVLSRGTPMHLDNAIDGLMEFDKILLEITARYGRNVEGEENA